ncbi:MAG: hypothetical protein H0T89_17595 [Deltaproteobacteria bacterium]|nr:hypothetical protein [Deltaproteobacteria bacterium]
MTHRFRRIALAAAVLPLVLLVGLRSAWAAYACRIDGEVRASCCCPKKEAKGLLADGAPRLAARDCCDVTIGEQSAAPQLRESERLQPNHAPDSAIATSLAPAAPPTLRTATTSRVQRARPPPSAIPTYLVNRTILR